MGKYTLRNRIICLFKGHIPIIHTTSGAYFPPEIVTYCARCDKILDMRYKKG